jgi:hypothetical protein
MTRAPHAPPGVNPTAQGEPDLSYKNHLGALFREGL